MKSYLKILNPSRRGDSRGGEIGGYKKRRKRSVIVNNDGTVGCVINHYGSIIRAVGLRTLFCWRITITKSFCCSSLFDGRIVFDDWNCRTVGAIAIAQAMAIGFRDGLLLPGNRR